MKKLISTIAVAGLLMSSAAHAGINPKNIDESSSRANILKVIDEKMAEGKTGGVIGMFAWTSINGEVYSASLAEIRRNARGGDYTKAFSEIIQQDVLEDVKIANQQELQDAIMALYSGNAGPSELEIAQQRIAFLQARGNLLEALIELDHDEHAEHIAGLKKSVADAHGEYLQTAADYVAEQVELGRDENGEAAAASISELTGVTATYDAETNTVSVDTTALEATKHAEGVASVNLNYDYDGVTYNIVTSGSANTDQLDALRAAAFANGEDNIDITIDMADGSYDIVIDGELNAEQLLLAMHDAVGQAADDLTGVSYSIGGGLVFDTGYGSVSDATASITNAGSLTITLNGSTKTVDLSSNSFDAGVDSVDVTVAYDGTDYDIVVDGVSDDDAIDDLMDANFDNGKADIQGKLDASVTAANVIDGITLTSTGNGQVTLSVDSGNGIVSTTAPSGVNIEADVSFTFEGLAGNTATMSVLADGTYSLSIPGYGTYTGATLDAVEEAAEEDFTDLDITKHTSTTNFTVSLADGYVNINTVDRSHTYDGTTYNLVVNGEIDATEMATLIARAQADVDLTTDNNQAIATAVTNATIATGITATADSGSITIKLTDDDAEIVVFTYDDLADAKSSDADYSATKANSHTGAGSIVVNGSEYTYTISGSDFAVDTNSVTFSSDLEDAMDSVYNEGYDDGYSAGYVDGYEDGFEAGQDGRS